LSAKFDTVRLDRSRRLPVGAAIAALALVSKAVARRLPAARTPVRTLLTTIQFGAIGSFRRQKSGVTSWSAFPISTKIMQDTVRGRFHFS
jgi:hypothetical protein